MSLDMLKVVRLLHAGEVPPKPLNGKGQRYSASTAKSIDVANGGCERRHWFEQVVGIDPPMGPALGIGTRVHGHVERALKKGAKLDVSPNAQMEERLAAKGLPHLPPHGTPGMHVEREFKMGTWPNGPEFTGTIDLMLEPEGWTADADDTGAEFAELLDHKTTGNYPKYALKGWALSERTKENLLDKSRKFLDDDVQNISYSRRMLLWYPVPFIKSTWVYYPKDGGAVVPVRATMERKETLDKWRERVVPLIEKMHEQHKQRPALAQVEANEEACGNYGGCPHKAYCVDYKDRSENKMGKLSAKLLDDHEEPKATKVKTDAPPMNPPPTKQSTASVFAEEKPKAAKKSSLASSLGEEETSSSPTSAPASKPTAEPTVGTSTKTSASPSSTTTSAPAGAGFALFLGCEPVVTKRPKVEFAALLAPLEERVAKVNKVAHVGLVKYDAVHHTAAALQEWLDENGADLDGANVVVGKSAFHQDVAERVLFTKAIAVARGLA